MTLLRSLRVRVLATVITVFAVSLAVAAFLAYELFLQDGRRDADVVLAREQERFELSLGELLLDVQADQPELGGDPALRTAVRRYLQLNPSTESYWTIVTFADGERLAAANGPPELEPLFRGVDGATLPSGELDRRETLATAAGDVRTVSVPVLVDDEPVAVLQIIAPLAPVRADALEAALLVAAASALALLVGGALLGLSLWRSLAPLGVLAATARSTELRSLGARVEEPATEDEVGTLAREFNTMLDRLEAASDQQREFMASAGHELRTPITIARGHLELLRDAPVGDVTSDETWQILDEELARMSRLVEDLMAIARAEMPDFVRPRSLELVQWFEDLELRLAGTPGGRSVQVVPPPPVELQVDPDRLAQAVLNLVNNAVVHTPEGTPVRVSATTAEGAVLLQVHDDGPGIPAAIRDELFTPFTRASEAPTSTGLGLAVVRAVVDAHGGEVTVDSTSAGTTFTLHLPWTDPEAPDGTGDTAELSHEDVTRELAAAGRPRRWGRR